MRQAWIWRSATSKVLLSGLELLYLGLKFLRLLALVFWPFGQVLVVDRIYNSFSVFALGCEFYFAKLPCVFLCLWLKLLNISIKGPTWNHRWLCLLLLNKSVHAWWQHLFLWSSVALFFLFLSWLEFNYYFSVSRQLISYILSCSLIGFNLCDPSLASAEILKLQ